MRRERFRGTDWILGDASRREWLERRRGRVCGLRSRSGWSFSGVALA